METPRRSQRARAPPSAYWQGSTPNPTTQAAKQPKSSKPAQPRPSQPSGELSAAEFHALMVQLQSLPATMLGRRCGKCKNCLNPQFKKKCIVSAALDDREDQRKMFGSRKSPEAPQTDHR